MTQNGKPHPSQNLNLKKRLRFISDFRDLKKQLKRKPHQMPKINEMLLKLEGFWYAASLDLNMGHYHI